VNKILNKYGGSEFEGYNKTLDYVNIAKHKNINTIEHALISKKFKLLNNDINLDSIDNNMIDYLIDNSLIEYSNINNDNLINIILPSDINTVYDKIFPIYKTKINYGSSVGDNPKISNKILKLFLIADYYPKETIKNTFTIYFNGSTLKDKQYQLSTLFSIMNE